ncbi:MAG: hypothetical protein DMF29_03470 [Verrucomicrobia bacterium]|nr:MAG: hypothetical protein DMF29_03470 [Verrucomicrobiota bacterium]
MKSIRPLASTAALVVLLICIYAFLLGNKVFDANSRTKRSPGTFWPKEYFVQLRWSRSAGFSMA